MKTLYVFLQLIFEMCNHSVTNYGTNKKFGIFFFYKLNIFQTRLKWEENKHQPVVNIDLHFDSSNH